MHGNARLTPLGRLTLVMRVEAGRPVAHVAAEMGVSRPTAYKWWRRWQAEGAAGLVDRSSRPRSCPHRSPAVVEAAVVELRRELKLGPARIGARLGVPASTVHRVLVRHGLNRLAWMDRPTGRVIRRYQRARPGELVHVDVKKLGRVPDGGGWRVHGRDQRPNRKHGTGWDFVHAAVDDYSRLAYVEALSDEKADTCVAFWRRARAFFAGHGIAVTGVMTDNAKAYLCARFQHALAEGGARHWPIPSYRPQANGKVERFNRTLADEWAYVTPWPNNDTRTAALDDWLHLYNHHRHHTAIGGPPISRVNDLPGYYT
ncbi:MAG TPA: IS481 family transposase [Actinomycetes bacterium]|nr:IS481 family transposase [Actinomycetes bacterium]